MDLNKINRDIQQEFGTRRILAEKLANENLSRANSYPVFHKIVALEKELIFELGKAEADGLKTSHLKKNLQLIRAQKTKFLGKLGLVEGDLKPKFSCEKCMDTGYIGTIPCECFLKEQRRRIIETSGFDFDHESTFENFDESICKNKKQSETLKKLKEKLIAWCEKYPNLKKKNIIFTGTTGSGKTFASECIANNLSARGFTISFVSAFQMNELFLKYHTTFNSQKELVLLPMMNCDILIIDDLGTEPSINNVTINYLYALLRERERFGRSTIITTNLLTSEKNGLLERYGDRIYSRLTNKNTSLIFSLEGDDLRVSR